MEERCIAAARLLYRALEMKSPKTKRPVVRSFKAGFEKRAADWVNRGGHAVFWESDNKARLYLPEPVEEDIHDFGKWTVYDLSKYRWKVEKSGPFKGLGTIRVPKDCFWIVRRRAERDSIHAKPTRRVDFDCLACGACCCDNDVTLDEIDIKRFKAAGRGELVKPPYAKKRKSDGRVHLKLLKNGRCRHLKRDNKCKIYEIRPLACSEFPMGSECCLNAREEELGIFDGVPAARR